MAWLTGASGTEPVDGPNHRGYPTIQLQKRAPGACRTPCLIQFWARVDGFGLDPGEWLSLATLTPDPSDRWSRVVTVNVGWEGWLHLFHVPDQGLGERAFQRTNKPFPRGRWVRITTWLDLDPKHGAAAVWQDGVLMSAARVRRRRRLARPAALRALRASLGHERQRPQRRHRGLSRQAEAPGT